MSVPSQRKNKRKKTLILIRHAHRDKPNGRQEDNGLSEKGKRQAKKVAAYFEKTHPGEMPYLISSPKVRCVETLQPLAKREKAEIQISSLLDEQAEQPKIESTQSFYQRVENFCQWWHSGKSPELTIACSHGDWIPACLQVLVGTPAELDKGGWAEITLKEGDVALRWMLQEFDRHL
jgi:broad specificity phosphatase PhoE